VTLFLSDADVRATFDWQSALDALRTAYAQPVDEAHLPPRTMARGGQEWLRTLSGVLPSLGLMGAKLIAASTRNRRASYLIPLFDIESAELVALLDANSITGFRTAATSAMAVDLLAPPGPLRVAVIGSGFEATHHLRAVAHVRELTAVSVFSPREASRERFCVQTADLEAPVSARSEPEAAVAGADLVLCAARSRDESPTLRGAWLRPGMTVVSIGSTLPEQRELDIESVDRADLVVADMVDEVTADTGDMIAAKAAGVTFADKLVSLAEVAGGRHPGRSGPEQVVVYKAVGSALQDLTVAGMCARRARELGLGTRLAESITPVGK